MNGRGFRRFFRLAAKTEARVHQEIDEELQAHIDARVDYLVRNGVPLEDARIEAVQRFGDFEAGRASLHAMASEQHRRLAFTDRIEGWWQDARYVMRSAARSPAFTAGIVATLAIGLGINSSVFRITDQVLLRAPSAVAEPDGIMRVESSMQVGGSALTANAFSYGDTRALVNANIARVSVYSRPTLVAHPELGRDIAQLSVDSVYFPLLGVTPVTGRLFDRAETTPGAGLAVAIVSYDYWKRVLGGAPLNESTSLVLENRTYHVIGVMPRGFSGIDLDPLDVWLPLGVGNFGSTTINGVAIPWYKSEMGRPLHAMLRLKSGISETVAVQRLSASLAAKDREGSPHLSSRTIELRPIIPAGDRARTEAAAHLLRRLSAVAVVILFIACANAANLLLARGLRRRQEIGVRLALGASRMRVARLLLFESLLLGCIGGVAAAVAGYWTGDALRRMLFPDGHWTTVPLDGRAIAFTAFIAILAGIAAGLAPALQLTSPDLSPSMKDRPGRGRVRTTRTALVVLQTAFTLALLVASGLLIRSLHRLNQIQLGYTPQSLVTIGVNASKYDVAALALRLRRDLNVRDVALASSEPFGSVQRTSMSVPGSTYEPDPLEAPQWIAVSENFFDVMRAPLLKGRVFNARDAYGGEPVVIVNRVLASRYWGGPVPEGGCVLTYMTGCARVVGIVDDMRDAHSSDDPPMRYYLPIAQLGTQPGALIIRARDGREASVVRTLNRIIPRDARREIVMVNDRVKTALRPWSVATLLFVGLGVTALTLACVGMYSVMSYLASERVHEIGVRIVLGATSADVLRMMMRDGIRVIAVGGAIGLAVSAWGARLLGSLLFGVSAFDPVVYAAGFVCLAVMALAATVLPAVRATRVDPATALRSE